MDFVALLLFLSMQYLRPQEWSSLFNSLRPVQVLAVISVLAILQRKQPVRLRSFWSSPQDFVVTAYFAWTVYASPTPKDTFSAIFPLVFFYFIAVLTLTSLPRIKIFLGVWAASIVFISALAIVSLYGFDPFDSAALTYGRMKGRLSLNLSIFNNPNALAHAIVPVIPMLYYLLFWKRKFAKVLLVVIVIPITAIMMTLSKGAFLSAAVTIFATLAFGRPKRVQIAMAVGAALFGGTMLYALPRMEELKTAKTDPAIQGRVAASRFGLRQMNRLTFGHGLGNFETNFLKYGPLEVQTIKKMGKRNGRATLIVERRWVHYRKAPHSAYVQNGADLGYIGFFLFIGVMYACLRTLVTARTVNNDEELIRRTLFAIVVWYAVSAWMVDFCYRSFFFFFAAATGALHRHLRGEFDPKTAKAEDEHEELPLPSPWALEREPAARGSSTASSPVTIDVEPVSVQTIASEAPAVVAQAEPEPAEAEPAPPPRGHVNWARLGLIDLVLTYLLTRAAIWFWHYTIQRM